MWQGHRKFDLFAERDERIHGTQRTLVSRIYYMDSLKDLEKYVDDAVDVFMKEMEGMQGQSIDMGLWVQLFAFGGLAILTGRGSRVGCRLDWAGSLALLGT